MVDKGCIQKGVPDNINNITLIIKKLYNMKNLAIITSLFFLLSAGTCSDNNDGHHSFIFKNNSGEGIFLQYSERYPDTLWQCDLGSGVIDSKASYTFELRGSFEKEFIRLQKKGIDYIQLTIVDSLIYETQKCDSIRENNLVLKRYQLNLETLEQNNWVITYP